MIHNEPRDKRYRNKNQTQICKKSKLQKRRFMTEKETTLYPRQNHSNLMKLHTVNNKMYESNQ